MISYRRSDLIDRIRAKKVIGIISFHNPGDEYVLIENKVISDDKITDIMAKVILGHCGFLEDDGQFYYVCDARQSEIPSPAELFMAVYMQLESKGFDCKIQNDNIGSEGGRATIEIMS